MKNKKTYKLIALWCNAAVFLFSFFFIISFAARFMHTSAVQEHLRTWSGFEFFRSNSNGEFYYKTPYNAFLVGGIIAASLLIVFSVLRTRLKMFDSMLPAVFYTVFTLALCLFSILIFINVGKTADKVAFTRGWASYANLILGLLSFVGGLGSLIFNNILKGNVQYLEAVKEDRENFDKFKKDFGGEPLPDTADAIELFKNLSASGKIVGDADTSIDADADANTDADTDTGTDADTNADTAETVAPADADTDN